MSYQFLRPFLFSLDAETAHHAAFAALDTQAVLGLARLWVGHLPEKPVQILGLRFRNPIGLAAGLDKDARHLRGLAQLGFGFLEVGTLTPRPQPGNPKPRLFRLPEHEALINRLGFNNEGVEAALPRLATRSIDIPVGVNIGKNAATPIERAVEDYLQALRALYRQADYITVNVSSPNTKHLRDLQAPKAIESLVRALVDERDRLQRLHAHPCPIAVKIAPDLEELQISAIIGAILDGGADAIIATNTTLQRETVKTHPLAQETGGLSGAPLRDLADRILAHVVAAVRGRVPVIGVGGIMSVADAQRKLDLGAALVQVYTGLIYRGPGFVGELVRGVRI